MALQRKRNRATQVFIALAIAFFALAVRSDYIVGL
jgi:hypothetical protein